MDSSFANMSSVASAWPPIKLDICNSGSRVLGMWGCGAAYLVEHGADTAAECRKLAERLLQHGGEGQEAQRVPCWRSIEDDDGVLHGFHMSDDAGHERDAGGHWQGWVEHVLHDLREAHSLIHTRDGKREVLHHRAHHPIRVGYPHV